MCFTCSTYMYMFYITYDHIRLNMYKYVYILNLQTAGPTYSRAKLVLTVMTLKTIFKHKTRNIFNLFLVSQQLVIAHYTSGYSQ